MIFRNCLGLLLNNLLTIVREKSNEVNAQPVENKILIFEIDNTKKNLFMHFVGTNNHLAMKLFLGR